MTEVHIAYAYKVKAASQSKLAAVQAAAVERVRACSNALRAYNAAGGVAHASAEAYAIYATALKSADDAHAAALAAAEVQHQADRALARADLAAAGALHEGI